MRWLIVDYSEYDGQVLHASVVRRWLYVATDEPRQPECVFGADFDIVTERGAAVGVFAGEQAKCTGAYAKALMKHRLELVAEVGVKAAMVPAEHVESEDV